jgi:hypothetical protein
MLNDDEVDSALREALRDLLHDIEPSDTLVKRVHEIPRRERKVGRALSRLRQHRILAAVPIPLAAVLTAILVFGGSDVAPSFAVTTEPDGAVQVTIDDLTGISGANARLRVLGVSAVVVPMRASCTTHIGLSYEGMSEEPAPTISVMPAEIPAGSTIVLAAEQIGPNTVEMAFGQVTGAPPSCVAPSNSGPGLGASSSPAVPQSPQTSTGGKS